MTSQSMSINFHPPSSTNVYSKKQKKPKRNKKKKNQKSCTYSQNSLTGSVISVDVTFKLFKEHNLTTVLFMGFIWSQQSKFFLSYGLTQLIVFQKFLHVLQGTS